MNELSCLRIVIVLQQFLSNLLQSENFKWTFAVSLCVCACSIGGCAILLQRAAADMWSWPVNAAGVAPNRGEKKDEMEPQRFRSHSLFVRHQQTNTETEKDRGRGRLSHFPKREGQMERVRVILKEQMEGWHERCWGWIEWHVKNLVKCCKYSSDKHTQT